MKKPAEIDIVRRAYELWQQAGEPDGKDQEFYHLAEQELRNADESSPMRTHPKFSDEHDNPGSGATPAPAKDMTPVVNK
jgi:hypothetical protein